jgi:hypothetical protein
MKKIPENQKKCLRIALGYFDISTRRIQKPKKKISKSFFPDWDSKKVGPRRKGV